LQGATKAGIIKEKRKFYALKIIHCADIHLGSALTAHFNKEVAAERNNEVTLTFERLAEAARSQGVRAVIIAGDLFDQKSVKKSLIDTVLKAIAGAPDTDFLYLKGNHDKDTPFPPEDMPENLKVFGTDWTYFDYGDVTIAGVRLTKENCASVYGTLNLKAGRTNIVVMHGKLVRTSGKAPEDAVNILKLAGKNIDYLALGDYHAYQKDKLDGRGIYCYSGCLEGRGFDEFGEKGYVLLECKRGNISDEFVPFAKRSVIVLEADISGAGGQADIEKAIGTAVQGIGKENLVRVRLTGLLSPETHKGINYLTQKFADRFYYFGIKDETRVKIDYEACKDGVSLKSEFIRTVLADASLDEEQKEHIIAIGINALMGERYEL
jgi:DNA repair exonuclease SbcCD nuclease subunit